MHVDRCHAVAKLFDGRKRVLAIELAGRSDTYGWGITESDGFERITLFPDNSIAEVNSFSLFLRLLLACLRVGPADIFLCHYEYTSTFAAACVLRILRRRVFVMNDSKFDDKPRWILKELLKALFYIPYNGALAASKRCADYLEFLRFSRKHIVLGYDVVSIERIRTQAQVAPAPDGTPFASRHFTIIARFVPKKNIFAALDAFSLYVQRAHQPRTLHLCGSGPLEPQLKEKVKELRIESHVVFRGQVDSVEVSRTLGNSLALILTSIEEQFGLVVIEAQAMGVPAIVTPNCGARDELVRTGVNGFLVEADNPKGIAYFMQVLDEDEACWTRMASAARKFVPLGDARRFARACQELTGGSGF
jgi:glycosyltransferase involved in cell wall biosynthesis